MHPSFKHIKGAADREGCLAHYISEQESMIAHRLGAWSGYKESPAHRSDLAWLETLKGSFSRFAVPVKTNKNPLKVAKAAK